MRDDLKYPDIDAVKSVLTKIGVDLSTRNLDCQDYEYTTCKLEELDDYVSLYNQSSTSIYEKRVLGCYFLECLNEYVQINYKEHPLQNVAFKFLYSDADIHKTELEYWTDTEGRNEQEWWPITKYLLNWQNTNKCMQ